MNIKFIEYDEIKEILEQLEWYRKIGKKDVYYPECVLSNKKAFILLDYITKLQEQLHQAIQYIKSQQVIFKDYDIVVDNQLKNLLEILGDKE